MPMPEYVRMLKITAIFSLLMSLTTLPGMAADAWVTDAKQAKELAAENNTLILIRFTNSSLGGWCEKLETLTNDPVFNTFAEKHLTRLLVDLPTDATVPEDIAAVQKKMITDYKVRHIPTLVVTDAKGSYILQTHYKPIPAVEFVKDLKRQIEKATGNKLK